MKPSSTGSPILLFLLFCLTAFAFPDTAIAVPNACSLLSPGETPRTCLLTTGQLSLCQYVTEGPAVPFEESYAPDTAQKVEWYLCKEDTGQKLKVTPYNYKSVLKLLLVGRPDLLDRLGKKGYRFQDIPSIVDAYNVI